jgi:hypothetical protein
MSKRKPGTRLLLLGVLGLLLLASPVFAQTASISQIRGKVEIRLPGKGWTIPGENQEIPANTMVSTGINSTARLQIGGSSMVLQPLTRLSLEEIRVQASQEATRISLNTGRVSAQVRSTAGREVSFEVRSPVATASVRGTDFDFDGVRLQVSQGAVAVINQSRQQIIVGAGGSTTAGSKDAPQSVVATLQANTQSSPTTLPPLAAPAALPAPAVAAAVVAAETGSAGPTPILPPATTSLLVQATIQTGQ